MSLPKDMLIEILNLCDFKTMRAFRQALGIRDNKTTIVFPRLECILKLRRRELVWIFDRTSRKMINIDEEGMSSMPIVKFRIHKNGNLRVEYTPLIASYGVPSNFRRGHYLLHV